MNSTEQTISLTVFELTFKIILAEREIVHNQYITDRHANIENGGKSFVLTKKEKIVPDRHRN